MLSPREPQTLAKTKDWWVVFKPSGWLSIGASSTSEKPVLTDWLRQEGAREGVQSFQVFVVHRLDEQTTGVQLFARNAEAHQRASQWFQQRKVKKTYRCLAEGKPQLPMYRLNSGIRGQPALTQMEVLERFDLPAHPGSCFLAQVRPVTGRRHQIRIHLSGLGFPLCGDVQYGGASDVSGIPFDRVALHAASLQLPTGEIFVAEDPDDFQGWLQHLRELKKNGCKDA